MNETRTHLDLKVYNQSLEIVERIYDITNHFPTEERFGLVQQMRRSAVSVVSNIAEGAGRLSTKENINFLSYARGSLVELQTQLIICDRIKIYRIDPNLMTQILSTKKMINGLIRYYKK